MMKNLTVTVLDIHGRRWTRKTDASSPSMFSNRFRLHGTDHILSYDDLVDKHGPLVGAVSGRQVDLVGHDLIEVGS